MDPFIALVLFYNPLVSHKFPQLFAILGVVQHLQTHPRGALNQLKVTPFGDFDLSQAMHARAFPEKQSSFGQKER